jgi:hypothetical protein
VAPPGNQAATEKTNINLYHSENPVYSPKVAPAISVSLVDPVCFVSLVRLETNFALPGHSFRLFK